MATRDAFEREQKFAESLVRKYPLIKAMWKEREKIFDEAHRKEAQIEAKYNKLAKKAGLKSLRFAYAEYCFGIDVNDVYSNYTNLDEERIVIQDFMLKNLK
jgi:hypothetical protein